MHGCVLFRILSFDHRCYSYLSKRFRRLLVVFLSLRESNEKIEKKIIPLISTRFLINLPNIGKVAHEYCV